MPLTKILADLADQEKPLATGLLAYLSGLSKEEVRLLDQTWSTVEASRRRQVMEKLVDLAEDNTELDFNAFFRRCLQDEEPAIRVKAIEGLWECEDRWLLYGLERLLCCDPSAEVRAAAATALGRFILLAELGKLRPEEAGKLQQALFACLENDREPLLVRRRAIEAVGHLSLPRVTAVIEQAYASLDRPLRVSSLYAMGRNADPRWLPILFRELENDDGEMRYEATHACGELGDPRAAPYLIPLMDDPDPEVQLAAVDSLGKVGGSLAHRALRSRLHEPDKRLRQAVANALEELEATRDPFNFEIGS